MSAKLDKSLDDLIATQSKPRRAAGGSRSSRPEREQRDAAPRQQRGRTEREADRAPPRDGGSYWQVSCSGTQLEKSGAASLPHAAAAAEGCLLSRIAVPSILSSVNDLNVICSFHTVQHDDRDGPPPGHRQQGTLSWCLNNSSSSRGSSIGNSSSCACQQL